MKPWLQGDFGNIDVRSNMAVLRDCIQKSAHRGADLHAFWLGLVQFDPLACADLALGPKAIAHPAAVESSLVILEHLEKVVAPSGLYGRLLALAPTMRPQLATLAARRFPDDSWIWRVDAGDVHGINVLRAHEGTSYFQSSCEQAARMGLNEALKECVQGEFYSLVLQAVWRAVGAGLTIRLSNKAIEHHPVESVLSIMAALLGPSTSEGIRILWPTLKIKLEDDALNALQRSFSLD